ncbi:MAG: DoxX family protein [Bacteroidia bacterium]|jgi:hypothetical protein|nr:DoxX family protein [Bacteroidia bacterium]
MKTTIIISSLLRITIAVILLQTLYFKFTAHPDSVHIFTELGVEPWGRITLGILELIIACLVALPKTKTLGIIASLGIIIGAIGSHFLVLGFNVQGDGGGLFTLALVVFISSILYLVINKINLFTYVLKLLK